MFELHQNIQHMLSYGHLQPKNTLIYIQFDLLIF